MCMCIYIYACIYACVYIYMFYCRYRNIMEYFGTTTHETPCLTRWQRPRRPSGPAKRPKPESFEGDMALKWENYGENAGKPKKKVWKALDMEELISLFFEYVNFDYVILWCWIWKTVGNMLGKWWEDLTFCWKSLGTCVVVCFSREGKWFFFLEAQTDC